jgi:hypothetical protein
MDDKKLKKILDFFSAIYEEAISKHVKISIFHNIDCTRSEVTFKCTSGSTKFETETWFDWDKFQDTEDGDSYLVSAKKEVDDVFKKINILTAI